MVVFGSASGNVGSPGCVVKDSVLSVRDTAKCLGHWWSNATKCVDENIRKARKAFFGYVNMQGSLNPLFSAFVIDCCVISVLLYGAESWNLTLMLIS